MRRLQRTGGSSIIITLPKKWIEKNKLKEKDVLKISSPTSQTLVLQPANLKREIHRSILKIDTLSYEKLTREIIAHYISGVDEISVQCGRISPEQRNKIRSISHFLTGFEMIDESAEIILLKNIFDPTKFPISKNIEKMFLSTTSMFQDALKAFMQNDKMLANDVMQRDFEIDKLYLIIKRQRHSFLQNKISEEDIGLNLADIQYYEDVAVYVERIADHAVKIARVIAETDKTYTKTLQLSSPITRATNKIIKLLKFTNEMVKKFDKNLAHEIMDITSEIKKSIHFADIDDKEEAFIVNVIEDSFDRVRGYTMNIAEITLDLIVERENS